MKKKLVVAILVIFCLVCSAILASAQQPEVSAIQAAIEQAGANWTAGDTSVGALSPEERSFRLGFLDVPVPKAQRTLAPAIPAVPLPSSLDWRNNGGNFVTGVRDQGNCGSCWAFGSVGGLESRTLITNQTPGTDLDLSEQVVVSCSGYGSCYGGYLVDNFLVNTGVPVESCYPYTATNGSCGNACSNWQSNTYKVSKFKWIVPYGAQQTVDALKYALVSYGPTEVTFCVYTDFYWYVSGVYTHVTGNLQGYHAVLLVGYDDVNSCFIVKNSWGPGWGESGYFRIGYSEVTSDCEFGYETLSYGEILSKPSSAITFPSDGATIKAGTPLTVTGTASDINNLGMQKVDVLINDGSSWTTAKDTSVDGSWSTWSYDWAASMPGSYSIVSRATNSVGAVESPGAGITYSVTPICFHDNMESSVPGWSSSTGLWHLVADGVSPYPNSHSPTHAWWFGQDATGNYDNKQIATGDIISNSFFIPAGAKLTFWSWENTEDTPGQDLRVVSVSNDDGVTWTNVFDSHNNGSTWYQVAADISAFGDKMGKIKFTFDTVDRRRNRYRGWYIDDVAVSSPPVSTIQSPSGGATISGPVYKIKGNAADNSGMGIKWVEISTDGGWIWRKVVGTTFWSYSLTLPPSGGSKTIISRATDNIGNVEKPGSGVSVTISAYGNPERPHCNWDPVMIQNGNDCTFCHTIPNKFLSADFRKDLGFCYTCHNAAGKAHTLSLYSSRGQHAMFVNATATGRRRPTYGNITAGEKNNIPASRLEDGCHVTCITCHNDMKKSDDPGRVWEFTATLDRYKYYLRNGGWSGYGNLTPKVYRDTSLWSGPTYSKTRKSYLVAPSEYAYNEMSGFIRFKAQQASESYVYVTLYYPYLRAPMQDNALCSDCHTQATHMDINCLNCHQAHNTGNLKGIKERLRASNFTTVAVKFLNYSKTNSFADGDVTYDGICEVCHTQTKYYRRDGSGFTNHSGGANQSGKNCTNCHTHISGFAK